uniref:Potassium channel tetramerization domain containing 14 n=1 Tax=Sinocyclocheilus rhinocerous TaxID=307959 RepID=A0A673G370_9TELE
MYIKAICFLSPQKSQVVQLNIGGHVFSTTLGTIHLFNGSTKRMDSEGRHFVDRDGTYFGCILEYLRMERLPTEHLQEVHKKALYYDIKPLVKAIEETPQFFGETVGRQPFLARVPNYRENLEVIVCQSCIMVFLSVSIC